MDDVANPQLHSCDSAEIAAGTSAPPRLHFFSKSSTETVWQHDWVDLGTYCFEDDNPASEVAWRPICVISGVTIRGSRAYVATNDGRFWEYDTAPGSGQADIGKWFVNGYAEGWPRFRSDNRGSAR